MKLNRAESRLNCEISISRKLFEIYSDRSLERKKKKSHEISTPDSGEELDISSFNKIHRRD